MDVDSRSDQSTVIAQLFNFTHSEAMVDALLTGGAIITEVAAKTGITENRVRTYAKRVLAKTAT